MMEHKENPAEHISKLLDRSDNLEIRKFSEFIQEYNKAPPCYYLKEAAMHLSEKDYLEFSNILSESEEFRLRYEVAFCRYTPDLILNKLSKDKNNIVRNGYFSNPKTLKGLDKYLYN